MTKEKHHHEENVENHLERRSWNSPQFQILPLSETMNNASRVTDHGHTQQS